MPTEERRLVEEEGSLSKKTWLRKKEVRVHWASSCPGPQWCSRSELVSSCSGPGSDLFTVPHCHLELLSGRAWLGVRWVLRPWHLESAVLITSLHTFPWPDVTYWTMGELLFWAPSSSSGEVCLTCLRHRQPSPEAHHQQGDRWECAMHCWARQIKLIGEFKLKNLCLNYSNTYFQVSLRWVWAWCKLPYSHSWVGAEPILSWEGSLQMDCKSAGLRVVFLRVRPVSTHKTLITKELDLKT